MAAIKIPERYKPGFAVIAGLSDSSFGEFVTAASHAPTTFTTTRELEAWLTSEIKLTPQSDVAKLIESITSFHRLKSRPGVTLSRLASDLSDAAREGIRSLKIADGVDLSVRISALLALDAFNIVSLKAKELQAEAERIFIEARVISDIRPIFGEVVGVAPAMLIVHELKLVVHEGLVHKELYMALDEADIASLIKTLERAQEKARSLRGVLDDKGLRTIELSDKD